jgi:hypothetical protein
VEFSVAKLPNGQVVLSPPRQRASALRGFPPDMGDWNVKIACLAPFVALR